MLRRTLAVVVMSICLAAPAHAWSYKEHIQFARIAAEQLIEDPQTPPVMKEWLHQAVPDLLDLDGEKEYFLHTNVGVKPVGFRGVLAWVYIPDERSNDKTKLPEYGVPERLLHFIDLELLVPDDRKRGYQHDLSGKPTLADIPRDMKDPRYVQAGMLPFRVKQEYADLVKAFRDKRLTPKDEKDENNAVVIAAFVAHYAADNTQPQHSTLDYKSATYFADKRNAPNVHAEVEYRMIDDEKAAFPELRAEFWPLFAEQLKTFKDPVVTDDPFEATLEVSMKSYDALPLIGLAAMKAAGQAGTPQKPEGAAGAFDTAVFFRFKGELDGKESSVMEMKAKQTAWAVKRIARLWLAAWNEAGRQP